MSPTLGHQLGDPPPEPHTSLSSIDQEKHRGRGRILRWAPLWVYSFISSRACACAHASALVLKDLGPRLALIHTVGPVITLANKSSSLTTLLQTDALWPIRVVQATTEGVNIFSFCFKGAAAIQATFTHTLGHFNKAPWDWIGYSQYGDMLYT